MALPSRHIVHQGRVVASLGGTAWEALRQRFERAPRPTPTLPGPEIVVRVPSPPPALVRDYLRHVGGDPGAYRGILPPHLFPQWSFAVAAQSLKGIPYPLLKVLNGGCRLEMRRPLPASEVLVVRARLASVHDDDRRVVLRQHVVTGTASAPDALAADIYAVVPKSPAKDRPSGPDGTSPRKESPRVPAAARELAYWKLPPDAGLAFAMLTGDFNPVHWVRPYARAFGFKSTILHGFATMARAYEGLNRCLFAGAVDRIAALDVKLTRPLVLPARVGLYLQDHAFTVGDAPGGPAYLVGTFEEKPT